MSDKVFDSGQAAAYYDDAAVSRFYEACWGGADIHIGRYVTGRESVAEASTAMTQYLLERAGLGMSDRVLDIACTSQPHSTFSTVLLRFTQESVMRPTR